MTAALAIWASLALGYAGWLIWLNRNDPPASPHEEDDLPPGQSAVSPEGRGVAKMHVRKPLVHIGHSSTKLPSRIPRT